jgi:hypothetical protein
MEIGDEHRAANLHSTGRKLTGDFHHLHIQAQIDGGAHTLSK